LLSQLVQLTTQAVAIREQGLVEVLQQGIDSGRCVGHGQPWAIS